MDDDEIGIDPAIAAQMGFSSFGAKAGPSKRKYHDASFVEGQGENPKQKKHAGSGANNIALGARRGPMKANSDATATGQQDLGQDVPTNAPGTIASSEAKKEAKTNGKKDATSGLAAFLSLGKTLPQTAPTVGNETQTFQMGPAPESPSALKSAVNESSGLESTGSSIEARGSSAGPHLENLGQGVKNENGDVAYFLPSFLEDPWKELRNSKFRSKT